MKQFKFFKASISGLDFASASELKRFSSKIDCINAVESLFKKWLSCPYHSHFELVDEYLCDKLIYFHQFLLKDSLSGRFYLVVIKVESFIYNLL